MGLRKAHIIECLITAIRNKRKEAEKQIKQKMNRENTKQSWWYLQRTVKYLPPPPLIYVQTNEVGQLRAHNNLGSLESSIQGTCEAPFSMACSAPIMKHF